MSDVSHTNEQHEPVGEHPHRHGRLISWVLVGVIVAAFCAGGMVVDPGSRRRIAASGRDSAADPGVRLD